MQKERNIQMNAINKKIWDMCRERKWSIYELAKRTDLTYSTLNSSINRNAAPKIDTLERICEAFGITLAQFFFEDEAIEVLSKEEKELIRLYRLASQKKKEALLDLLAPEKD